MRSVFVPVLALLLAVAAAAVAQPETAAYTVTFETTWTAATHPQDYPANAHFSGLVGGTHAAGVTFWAEDDPASLGIQRMAEWGSQAELLAEVQAAIDAGTADGTIAAVPLWTVPGSVSESFTASADFPLVTLVTMIAPSPDWFVGVAGLDLRPGGVWAQEIVVPLLPWDAGTDSGVTYTSPDQATVPPEPVAPITAGPMEPGVPLGTFTFTLTGVSDVPDAAAAGLRVWPNPFNPRTTVAWEAPAAGPLRVTVYDLAGRRLRVLRDGPAPAGPGRVAWDGRDGRGRLLPAAAYLVRLEGAFGHAQRTVTLLK